MKRISLLASILFFSGRLMAQSVLNNPLILKNEIFTQPFKADTPWRNNLQVLKDSDNILQQLKLNKLEDISLNYKAIKPTNSSISFSNIDHMPVAYLNGVSKMPLANLKSNHNMPIISLPGVTKKVNP